MIIYKVTNIINGKVYIGKTKRTLAVRWKQHCQDAGKPSKRFRLHEDICELGKDNFTIEKVDEALSEEEASEKEILWIKRCDCIYPNGYNVSRGGKYGGNTVKIMNVTTGEIFETITDAAKSCNRHVQAIRQALDKPNRTCAGFAWVTIK